MNELKLEWIRISYDMKLNSLVKLHYFQFAFLENCVYKKQKKSIKDFAKLLNCVGCVGQNKICMGQKKNCVGQKRF